MNLLDVYSADGDGAKVVLYDLLKEREPHQNISHKAMPTWEQHCAFVDSRPYEAWYLIEDDRDYIVGATYLTRAREIGLFLFKQYCGLGYGAKALAMLQGRHPGRLLANVSIHNSASMAFFVSQGFEPLQITYELDEESNARSIH